MKLCGQIRPRWRTDGVGWVSVAYMPAPENDVIFEMAQNRDVHIGDFVSYRAVLRNDGKVVARDIVVLFPAPSPAEFGLELKR